MSIETKSWTNLATMSSKRSGAACAEVNGKIYITGGWNQGNKDRIFE